MTTAINRRRFLQLGAGAAVAVAAGCSSTQKQGAPRPAASPGRAADVVATYRAQPTTLDLAGTVVPTWGYSDSIPGRTLRARAGDMVEVTVDNALAEATSIHWHGLAIVNAMDGVPGVTQGDIEPDTAFTYRFEVPHPGTYWFHPHHGLQLERGLYAPLIIEDPNEPLTYDVEYVVVLDDWLDGAGTSPEDELVRIRETGAAMGDMSDGDHDMGGMVMATSPLLGGDAGDAIYPHHLINGRPITNPATMEPAPSPGDRIRLRIINAAGDTAYRVALGGHRMTVTHTDGFPVEPVDVDAFVIGMGERYDVTVDIKSGAWPLVALAEGKDARAAAMIRTRDTNTTVAGIGTIAVTELDGRWLRYADLRAAEDVHLAPPSSARSIAVALTGGMAAFDWGINGNRYSDHEPIEVDAGEWVTLSVTNETTMWHPIHVHGHTPQLDTRSGGVRKDTVNVLPGETVQLTFQADKPGTWMLHCHNAYHLEAGMATLITYRG
jgi:FtsP/CotA-like multicopper oxidase with cupredoxin domain